MAVVSQGAKSATAGLIGAVIGTLVALASAAPGRQSCAGVVSEGELLVAVTVEPPELQMSCRESPKVENRPTMPSATSPRSRVYSIRSWARSSRRNMAR
jgi:hypothetical protein